MFATVLNSIMEHPGQSVHDLTARLGKPTTVPADIPKTTPLEQSVCYESSITSTSQDLCSDTPSASSVCGTEAFSDMEAELRQLWSQVLSVPADCIDRTGHFFDLGGNSIRAMRLVNNAREAHLSLTVADVFKTPVLSDLAALLSRPATPSSPGVSSLLRQDPMAPPIQGGPEAVAAAAETTATAVPAKELHRLAELASQHHCFHHDNIESVVPATDAQAFMLAVSELDGRSLHNKAVLRLSRGLDTARLARACERVVRRQALLRTVFVQEGGRLYQAVLRALPARTVTFRGDDAHHVQPKGIEEARYLPRFQLQTDNPEDSDSDGDGDGDGNGGDSDSACDELHLHIHHVLYDAISLGLVLQDLRAAYMGEEALLPGTPKFSDWVLQVGASSSSSSSSSASSPSASDDYWRGLLTRSSMTTLSPPTLPVRGASRTRTVAFRALARNLQTRHGLPSSALNAAWAAALFLATGSRDLVFGAANANRSSGSFPHAFQVPGPCLNLLPVRATLMPPTTPGEEGEKEEETTFGSLIEQLQDQATSGIPHQHVGFRSIVRRCTDWRSWTRLGSVIVYQNYEAAGHSLRFGDVDAAFSGEGTIGDSTDFWIIAKPVADEAGSKGQDGEEGDDLDVEIVYSPHRVSEAQARWVSRCLESVLAAVPALLEAPLGSFRKLVDGPVPRHVVPATAVAEPVAIPPTSDGPNARASSPPPPRRRRRANTVLASVSALLEQPLDSFRKLGAADGPVTPPGPVPAAPRDATAADAPLVVDTRSPATAAGGGGRDARSAPQTPTRRRAHSVLESVSTLLKQPLGSFQTLLESPTATTPVHVRAAAAAAAAARPVVLLSDGDEASARDEPKKRARALVARAWREVGLRGGRRPDRRDEKEGEEGEANEDDDDEEGVSLFDRGGDLETVLLLSWWYRYRGHGVSMYDIIENPTRGGQWGLIRKGLRMG